jgi:mannan endo-1,4-beta-mannosidase
VTLPFDRPPDRPPRPRRGYRVLAGATGALAVLVTYIVVASGAVHDRTEAAAPSSTAPSSAAPSPVAPAVPQVVRTPTLGLSTPTLADLDRFIEVTGTTPEVFDVFEPWNRDRPLDPVVADALAAKGIRLSITWEPWDVDVDDPEQPAYSLTSIIEGRHDAYIDMYARSIADHGHPVTIRLMHEMNGNWYPWSTGVNGNREGEFVRAWQHVHDRFTALGVTGVQWLWAPNAVYPGAQPLAPLYPGDAYVDAVGVSNYNWGDDRHDGSDTVWTSFGGLFDASFAELRAITQRPIWVAETGSSNRGGDKSAWLAAMLAEIAARPEIAGVVWFSHVDEARDVDWRIETEPDTAEAWRQGFLARPVLPGPGG